MELKGKPTLWECLRYGLFISSIIAFLSIIVYFALFYKP